MANRSRKELQGRDFQRVKSLERSLKMIVQMDVERMYYNSLSRPPYVPPRVLLAEDAAVRRAIKVLGERIDEMYEMYAGENAVAGEQ